MRVLTVLFFLFLTGQACGGEVQEKVERFVDSLYQKVEALKASGFRQYVFYEGVISEIKKPPPVKKPNYEALQEKYLKKYLEIHGEKE